MANKMSDISKVEADPEYDPNAEHCPPEGYEIYEKKDEKTRSQ